MFSFSKTKRTPQMARLQGMALSEEALEGVVGGVGVESGEGAEDPTAAEQMQEQLESAADTQSPAGGVSTSQEEESQKLLKQMEELAQQSSDDISAGTDTLNGEEVPPQGESATENQTIASLIEGGFDNATLVLPDGLAQAEEIPAMRFEESPVLGTTVIDAASVRPQDGTGEGLDLTKLVNLAQNLQGDSIGYGVTAAEMDGYAHATISLSDLVQEANQLRGVGVQ